MGIGAFTMGKMFGGDSWWGLLLAVVVSGAVGALVALPAFRLRGLYLALATFAFGEVMYSAFFDNSSVISDGTSIGVGRLPLPFMHAVGDRAELIEVAVVAALCAVLVGLVRRSALGRRLVAMSDSPAAFATVGLSSVRTKMIVFTLSAAMAGLGGVFYAGQQGGIGANDVQFIGSLTLLLFVAIWGIRTVTGALLGRPDGGGAPRAPDAPARVAGRPHRPGRRHRDRAARPQPRRDPRHGVADEPGAPALRRRGARRGAVVLDHEVARAA